MADPARPDPDDQEPPPPTRKPRRRPKKAKPTAGSVPELVAQPNGGALRSGGTPGNVGGLGVPPSLIRELARKDFYERMHVLRDIADGLLDQEVPTKQGIVMVKASLKDRLKAMELLGRYGGIELLTIESKDGSQGVESGEAVMRRVLQMVGRALLTAPRADRLAVIQSLEVSGEVVDG